jgi:hypothetical protein
MHSLPRRGCINFHRAPFPERRTGMAVTNEIMKCRICGNSSLTPVLNLGLQQLSGRFPSKEEPDPPAAPLELVLCAGARESSACGLLQLRHSVRPDELYLQTYGYRSGINGTMSSHLRDVVASVESMSILRGNDVILDIGSNDGTLLKAYQTSGIEKVGMDPTGAQFAQYYPPDIRLIRDFFSAKTYLSEVGRTAKVITSIAMFYDLESPMSFVQDIAQILATDGIWVFEQSYMPTMLRMNSFDTICHEHLEYYSLRQIDWLLQKCGLRMVDLDFNEINGGSFRISACHKDSGMRSRDDRLAAAFAEEKAVGLNTEQPFRKFRERVFNLRSDLRNLITAERKKGKSVYAYGASTKGNVLLQFCGLDHTLITAAADRNQHKWGCRTPGTNIPIVSEEEARKAKPDFFLVLPWHFREEFIDREMAYLRDGGRFIFPLPNIEIVSRSNANERLG